MAESGQETKQIRCNCCRVATNHVLQARYTWFRNIEKGRRINIAELPDSVRSHITQGKLDGICKHENSIWTCAGCDTACFEWQLMYSIPGEEGGWEELDGGSVSTRPNISMKVFRMKPEISRLYEEVLTSFESDCLLLCTIGLRALIEGVCRDKGLVDGNLETKVDGLIKFLPSINVIEALHTFRALGNDAAHRLEAMTREEAELAIDLVEDLLKFLYDLDYKAAQVRNTSKRITIKSAKLGSVQ